MQQELNQRKRVLVEKMGVHFENKDQLAPVAARILAYIILTGKSGTTFEDLVTNLCASKSTISTHLSHLQDLSKLGYFTKSGDRKKYFIVNADQILLWIDEMMDKWNSEKELHFEVMEYKQEHNSLMTTQDEERFDLDFHQGYIKFLESASTMISELREQQRIKN